MKTRFTLYLLFASCGLMLLSAPPALGADDLAKNQAQAKLDGFVNLIRAVGGLEIPDLTGLISPENMGVLSDNQSRISDNEANLLSGNEAEITCLSGNQVSVLSDLRIFSGITINIDVTIQTGQPEAKPQKRRSSQDSKEPRERRTHKKKSSKG